MTGTVEGMDGNDVTERVVTVALDGGLHARPAARLVEVARSHDCTLAIEHNGRDDEPVRADSMLAITSLGVETGDHVRLLATGADAGRAVRAAAAALEGGEAGE